MSKNLWTHCTFEGNSNSSSKDLLTVFKYVCYLSRVLCVCCQSRLLSLYRMYVRLGVETVPCLSVGCVLSVLRGVCLLWRLVSVLSMCRKSLFFLCVLHVSYVVCVLSVSWVVSAYHPSVISAPSAPSMYVLCAVSPCVLCALSVHMLSVRCPSICYLCLFAMRTCSLFAMRTCVVCLRCILVM